MNVALILVRSAGRQLLRPEGGIFAVLHAIAAQGLTMGLNVATGIITARLLGATGRGEFAAASLWLFLPPMLAIAGVQNAIVYQTGVRPNRAASISVAGLLISTAMFIPIAGVCILLMPRLMQTYRPEIIEVAQIAIVTSILQVWFSLVRQSLLAVKNFAAYNSAGYLASLTYLLLLIGLVLMAAVTPQNAVLVQIIATLIVLVGLMYRCVADWQWRRVRPRAVLRAVATYGLKAAPIDIVSLFNSSLDRLVLIGLVAPAELGMYAVALSFARILLVLQAAVSAVALVDLTTRPRAEVELFVQRMFRLLLWILVLTCGVLYTFDQRLLSLVYGPSFAQATTIFRILLIEASASCIGQVLMQVFLAAAAPGIPSFIQVASLVVTALTMFAVVPTYGAVGAAAAVAIASILKLACLLGCLHRIGVAIPSPLPRLSDFDPILDRYRRMRGYGMDLPTKAAGVDMRACAKPGRDMP